MSDYDRSLPDGEYWLTVPNSGGAKAVFYCMNISFGATITYLPLPAGPETNYGYTHDIMSSSGWCSEDQPYDPFGRTEYTKIRIRPPSATEVKVKVSKDLS